MAWTYLAESEESALHSAHGSERSPIVRSSDTLEPSYFQECQREQSTKLQSGTMCERLQQQCCHELTSLAEVSHVRTLAAQDLERAWMGSEVFYSVKQRDLFENVDLSSYSSKMSKESEDLFISFGKSSRRLATIAETDSSKRQRLELHIGVKGGGYWPTPMASDSFLGFDHVSMERKAKGECRPSGVKIGSSLSLEKRTIPFLQENGRSHPSLYEWLMGFPITWTDLKPLATQWFLCKPEKPLKSCQD